MSEVQPVVAEAAPAPVTIVEPVQPTVEDTMGAVWDKLNPSRADDGKFQAKEPAAVETAPPEGAEKSDTETITDKEPVAPVEEAAKPSIPRPQSLSSEVDKLWNELPPAAQELWAKRESESNKKITELAQTASAVEPLRPHLEQLGRVASQRGITAPDALQRLIAADDYLSREPAAAIQWLAKAYGIDPTTLAPQQFTGDTSDNAQINALTQRLAQAEQRLAQTANQITSRERAEMQTRERSLTDSISKFAEGKDYWSDIETEVVNQVHALKLADPARAEAQPLEVLKEAHDRAIKLVPAVQEKLDKVAKEAAAKEKAAADKKKADEAKRLASLNVRSSSSSPNTTHTDMRSEMEAVYERLNGRG